MKSENLAFILNFFLPGVGLVYLGRWGQGLMNLGIVLGIGVLLALLVPEEWLDRHINAVAAGLAGGSGGWAMVVAREHNRKAGMAR